MPIVSIGDMSQHFMSLQNSGRIKSDLAQLGQELSTGKAADVVEKLGGQTRQLSGINHSLEVLTAYQRSADETSLMLEHMQLALDRVDQQRDTAAGELLKVSPQSLGHQITNASQTAAQAFSDIVSALNTRLSGRSLFAGAAVDRTPLAKADEMLDDIRANLVGATTQTDVSNIVEQWFDDPAGGFATMGYLGDTGGKMERTIGPNQSIKVSLQADDPSTKELLRATALAALAGEMSGALTHAEQANLLQGAGASLIAGAGALVSSQSAVGSLQGSVEAGQTRLASEQSSLSFAYNDLTEADPFETATRLQAVQTQLETHFAVTARLSRLSLADYI